MFDTVLTVRRSDQKNNVWNLFPMDLLTLGSKTSSTTIGVKEPNNDHVSRRILCSCLQVHGIWKPYSLLKLQFKSKIWMNGSCYDITPVLGTDAGYCAKRSHNRMIDSHCNVINPAQVYFKTNSVGLICSTLTKLFLPQPKLAWWF